MPVFQPGGNVTPTKPIRDTVSRSDQAHEAKLVPMNDKCIENEHVPQDHSRHTDVGANEMSVAQPRRGSDGSPSRGTIAIKRLTTLITSPQKTRHRKAHSDHTLQLSYNGQVANMPNSRRSLPIVDSSFRSNIHSDANDIEERFIVSRSRRAGLMSMHRKAGPPLSDRLVGIFEQEALTYCDFIPNGKLDHIVTQASVDQELLRIEYLPAYLRHRLGRKTRPRIFAASEQAAKDGVVDNMKERNFQKIFTILVLIRCPERIWAFVREDVHDGDLPLCSNRTKTSESLRRKIDSSTDLTCLKARSDVREFLKRQWYVLVPTFNPSEAIPVPRLRISNGEILPFLTWNNKSNKGGSSEVYKVTIHESHHSFQKKQVRNNVVAVKKIPDQHKASFEREYNILRHLGKPRHVNDHLVTLLAAYEQNDHFYLLLPWAESDLYRYWRETSPQAPCGNSIVSEWIQKQCCGLAGAVATIHRYFTSSKTSILRDEFSSEQVIIHEPNLEKTDGLDGTPAGSFGLIGRHGDIKPTNILWYPEPNGQGILRLADFGTAYFSSASNGISAQDKDNILSSTPYRSPESILHDGQLSYQCDVWALGCVFLEFVCWYAGGGTSLECFEKDRACGYESTSFFYPRRNGSGRPLCAEIKEPVKKMISELQESECIQRDRNMLRLLSIVQQEMLVISPLGRTSAGNISRGDLASIPSIPESP